jgi:hypothetical protein
VPDLEVCALDLAGVVDVDRNVLLRSVSLRHLTACRRAGDNESIEISQQLPVSELVVRGLQELRLLGEHAAVLAEERFGRGLL